MTDRVASALSWINPWTPADCVVAIRAVSECRILLRQCGGTVAQDRELGELEKMLPCLSA